MENHYITFYKYMKNFFTIQHKNLVNNHTVLKLKKKKNKLSYFFPFQNKSHLPNKKAPLSSRPSRFSNNSSKSQLHYEHDPQSFTALNTSIPINHPFLGKPNNVKVSISLESVTIRFQYVRRGFNKGEGATSFPAIILPCAVRGSNL